MIKKITLFSALAIFSFYGKAQSFSALYSFDSVKSTSGLIDPTALPTATGLTFGHFSATGASANSSATGRFSFSGWPIGAISANNAYDSLTGSINTSEYYEVTLTPSSGFSMTLSSITFKAQRSGTGIRTYSVRSSADAYATNLSASILPANANLSVKTGDVFFWNLDAINSGQNGSTITLSGAPYTSATTPLSFRFYGWNSEGAGGTFSLDTVKFNGSASVASSISEQHSDILLSVYPNPSQSGVFTVDLGNIDNKTILTVYDIIGNSILTKEIFGAGKQQIDLSNEANGSYFIAVKNDNSTLTRKITINK